MKPLTAVFKFGLCSLMLMGQPQTLLAETAAAAKNELKHVKDFNHIEDSKVRARALFEEMGKVIQHPRCMNCHPIDNQPRQGDEMQLHYPKVDRGLANRGVAAMHCSTCHQKTNIDHAELPGHPKWHLAPIEMGWIGQSLAQICQQLKDPKRNGGKNMKEMHEHMAEDTLVGWGWSPGAGREPVPGTQKQFGDLFQAWVDNGAHCPK